MISYRDMTFCHRWAECADSEGCPRAITQEVLDDSKRVNLPLSVTLDFPCFKEVK
jgi:hypothetical protein